MSGNFIVNTPRCQMHALAFQGIMVTDCYPQLRDMLRQQLGDEYVLLFAEPASNDSDQSVDWYTPVQGAARPLNALPAGEQDALRERLAHMAREMRSLAEKLKATGEHAKVTRGTILELALRYPGEECLYAVGGQPVFTCWGFGPGTPGAEPQDLSRLARVAPSASSTAAVTEQEGQTEPREQGGLPDPALSSASERRAGCLPLLWWLLPLVLLLLLLWLLFTSFGGRPALGGTALFHAPLPSFCRADQTLADTLASLEEESAALEMAVEDLRARLEAHMAQCRPESAQRTPPPADPELLVIPEKATDMSFLQGQWRCETGLVNNRTKEPVVVEFSFDASGEGTGGIFERRRACTGAARGSLTPDGTLRIRLEEQKCGGGAAYTAQEIICRNREGRADCHGRNADGSPWDAHFIRKR